MLWVTCPQTQPFFFDDPGPLATHAATCSTEWIALTAVLVLSFATITALMVWFSSILPPELPDYLDDSKGMPRRNDPADSTTEQSGGRDGGACTKTDSISTVSTAGTLELQDFGLGALIGIVIFTLVGGFIAALFGSGGGMVIVPLLLQLGVAVQVIMSRTEHCADAWLPHPCTLTY